jgi:hypothetical protein
LGIEPDSGTRGLPDETVVDGELIAFDENRVGVFQCPAEPQVFLGYRLTPVVLSDFVIFDRRFYLIRHRLAQV